MTEYKVAGHRMVDGSSAVRLIDIMAGAAPENQERYVPKKAMKRYVKPVASPVPRVLVTLAVIVMFALLCYQYVALRTDIVSLTGSIGDKEIELDRLTLENDEEYDRIISGVDIDEIRRTALDELGMVYPDSGQVITFHADADDYVRQYSDFK